MSFEIDSFVAPKASKRIRTIFLGALFALLFLCVCFLLSGCFGGDGKSNNIVNCLVGEWTDEVEINESGTTFKITIDEAAPIYWKTSSISPNATFTNQNGEVVEREGMKRPGTYHLKIVSNSRTPYNIKVLFYNIYDVAVEQDFGSDTPYSSSEPIDKYGEWYKITLDKPTYTLLVEDNTYNFYQYYLYFASELRNEDFSQIVMSSKKKVATLNAGIYYLKIYSTDNSQTTNGRVMLTDITAFSDKITEDVETRKFTAGNFIARIYFENLSDGVFNVSLVDPWQSPRMRIYNSNGEVVATIDKDNAYKKVELFLEQGNYYVTLSATTDFKAEAKILFERVSE